jgi:hypothetical protein
MWREGKIDSSTTSVSQSPAQRWATLIRENRASFEPSAAETRADGVRWVWGSSQYTRGVGGRLLCVVLGGHRWRTISDQTESMTVCARCGTLRHRRSRSAEDMSFLMHTDVAADFSRRPTRGAEEPKAPPRLGMPAAAHQSYLVWRSCISSAGGDSGHGFGFEQRPLCTPASSRSFCVGTGRLSLVREAPAAKQEERLWAETPFVPAERGGGVSVWGAVARCGVMLRLGYSRIRESPRPYARSTSTRSRPGASASCRPLCHVPLCLRRPLPQAYGRLTDPVGHEVPALAGREATSNERHRADEDRAARRLRVRVLL